MYNLPEQTEAKKSKQPAHDGRTQLTMRDTITCLILLVACVNVLGAPIGSCTGEGSTASTNVLLPDSYNCSVYYRCSSGNISQLTCPSEQHFNPASQTCESPSSAGCQSSTLQTDLPTEDSTSSIPVEETTGEITTECVITEDGIGISTEYISESAPDSVSQEGTTLPNNEEVFYISTDITIQISTTDSPGFTEFPADFQTEIPDFANTASPNSVPADGSANLPATSSSLDFSSQSATLHSGQSGNSLPDASSAPLKNSVASGNTVQPTDGSGLTSANDVPADGSANVPATSSSPDSSSQSAVLPSGQPGNSLPAADSNLLPNAVASGNTVQPTAGSGLTSANDVPTDGSENLPATSSFPDSNTQSAVLPSGQTGNNLPAADSNLLTNAVGSADIVQSTVVSDLNPQNSVSADGSANLPAVSSSPDSSSQSAVFSDQPGNNGPDAGSAAIPNPEASGNTVQNTAVSGLVSANAVPTGVPANLLFIPSSSDSNGQSAVFPSGQHGNNWPATGSAVLPNPEASGNTIQNTAGSGLASANSLATGVPVNLPSVPSSLDSNGQSAVFPSGQPGNNWPATGSAVLPNPEASGNTVQNTAGSGLASANAVPTYVSAILPSISLSQDSNRQSAVLPSGWSVNYFSNGGKAFPLNPVSLNIPQLARDPSSISASTVSIDVPSKLPAVPSSGFPAQSSAQVGSDVSNAISPIQSKQSVLSSIAQSQDRNPVAPSILSVPTNFNVRPSVEHAAGPSGSLENVPYNWPYYFKNLVTELPSKLSSKHTSKITIEADIKSTLKEKIKSDLRYLIGNHTSVPNKQVDIRSDVTTEEHNSAYKKFIKEFINNVTTIFNQIPQKSHVLERNLPNFSKGDYKKFVKEFINNVTIAINRNPYKYQYFPFVHHHYSPGIYKRLVGEFVSNITAIHNAFSANRRKVSVDSLRRAKHQLIDDLDIDDSPDSEESEESSSSSVATTPKLSRPTTVHPRFEWIARKSQRKEEKQAKRSKHSDSDSSDRSSKNSDEDDD